MPRATKAAEPPKPTGRPSSYTPELGDEICERLAKGEPLAVICRDEHMPNRSTVYDWLKVDEPLSRRFARARDDGFDSIALDCLEIADNRSNDIRIRKRDGSDVEEVDHEHIARSKLKIETRLKLLAKWDPKRYGEKVALTGGSEDDAPVQFQNVSNRDRAKAVAALIAKSKGK